MSPVDARLGEFPARDCVDIKTILNTTAVNISSISFPNSSTAVTNQVMEQNGATFNFTFCDTTTIGVYNYDYNDAEGQVFVNDFLITPNGDTLDTGGSILYIILLILNLIFLAIFLTISIVTPYRNLEENTIDGTFVTKVTRTKYVKLVSIWITYGIFLWLITIITGMTNNYIRFEELTSMITNLYLFFYTVGYGVSFGIIWFLFYNLWKDILFNKIILREGKALFRGP